MVSRTVTVVITVTVSVAPAISLGSVQDQGHILIFLLSVDLFQLGEHAPFE